jgi:hypothetical protein
MKWFVYGIAIDKKISLPFIDDFSSSSVYPDPNKWMDKQVFINNDFPIRPPSYNVATFDGLNSRGVPYGVGTGYCDSLTSLPINLFGYTPSDSLMLSFFVQPKGLGNLPRNGDSLLLEFRTNSYDNNSYTPVWYQSQVAYPKNVFTQVFVKVDSSFLHDDFQFRFRKKGDLSGNLHHWHIDYVRLDKGRISRDTAFSDISISSSPQGLIKNYTSVPWKHFIADSANLMNDSQYFYIKNNNNIAYAINFSREVFNEQPQRIDTFGNVLPTFSPVSDTTVAVGRKIAMQPFVTGDTVLFNSVFTVRSGVSFDNIPSNDVISVKTRFSNYLAYDDGTAEAGYGLEKAGGSVALGFSMPYADSLFGVAVFFNRSLNDVSNKPFNLQIYRAIGTSGGGQGEDIIKSIPFNGAVYTNNLNGFYYYKLEQPILVPSYFYVGWKQTELFSINVGCDENYRYNFAYGPNPNLYYKTSDLPIWQASSLTGTIMIRPIVGKWIDPPVGVTEVPTSKKNFFVSFPNPANDILQVQSNVGELPNELELIDVSGRTMMRAKNETTLHVNMLPEGIYFLKIIDKNNQASVIKISILHP